MWILGQKACFLGPTIFEIPQPNWWYYIHLHCVRRLSWSATYMATLVCSSIHRLAFYDRIYISLKSQQKPVHCDQYIMFSLFCVHLFLTLTFWKLRMIWENQSINHSYVNNVFFDFWPPNGPIVHRINPNWHELRKQEKCSSLAPPRSTFYKTRVSN